MARNGARSTSEKESRPAKPRPSSGTRKPMRAAANGGSRRRFPTEVSRRLKHLISARKISNSNFRPSQSDWLIIRAGEVVGFDIEYAIQPGRIIDGLFDAGPNLSAHAIHQVWQNILCQR